MIKGKLFRLSSNQFVNRKETSIEAQKLDLFFENFEDFYNEIMIMSNNNDIQKKK